MRLIPTAKKAITATENQRSNRLSKPNKIRRATLTGRKKISMSTVPKVSRAKLLLPVSRNERAAER
jgi:hypothetical protein